MASRIHFAHATAYYGRLEVLIPTVYIGLVEEQGDYSGTNVRFIYGKLSFFWLKLVTVCIYIPPRFEGIWVSWWRLFRIYDKGRIEIQPVKIQYPMKNQSQTNTYLRAIFKIYPQV